MRFGAVAVLGLAGWVAASIAAQAQQANKPETPAEQQQKAIVLLHSMISMIPGSLCPGALRAQRQALGGGTVWTTALGDPSAPWTARPRGLGVHVEFEDAASAVTALELRVSYLPIGLKVIPATAGEMSVAAKRPEEQEKTFDLDRAAAKRISADLLVGQAATITRVRLVSVTFANGNVWHEPSENACAVAPSGLMLVAQR